ncbi:hypothetical protein [Azospirillum thiophilum]|uniref:hypothetical protein n=1 Tax=Azospirillum thiophilum TaxID=528244 RepID=UPI000B242868|nr:hypothetical protein [Azospirillum thiophilum]
MRANKPLIYMQFGNGRQFLENTGKGEWVRLKIPHLLVCGFESRRPHHIEKKRIFPLIAEGVQNAEML